MELDLTAGYGRVDNVLYQDGVQIIRFTRDKFPDWDELRIDGVKYMQRYLTMYRENGWFDILPGYWTIYPTQEEVLDSIPFKGKEEDADFKSVKQNPVEFVKFIAQQSDELISPLHLEIVKEVMKESHDSNSSRLDQVRFWFNKGFKTASEIAVKIDANPSYVQRLVKQVKNEKDNNKS